MNMRLATKLALAPLLIAPALAAQTRVITRTEIAAAIQKSLAANDLSAGSPLQPDDISLAARIAVTEAHPTLAVTGIESRPASTTTHVALRLASEPRTPPFWVTVNRSIAPHGTQILRIARAPIQANPLARSTLNDRPLVHAGNPIELIVQGAGLRITSKAKALETGRAGQQIRVECQPAGKILVATIVTAQTAEIDY
jgi:Chaperone for flagella basal body P-ring formation